MTGQMGQLKHDEMQSHTGHWQIGQWAHHYSWAVIDVQVITAIDPFKNSTINIKWSSPANDGCQTVTLSSVQL